MSEYILTHKQQTHPHAASGWRIHCGVEVTELSTNKQHTLSQSTRSFPCTRSERRRALTSGVGAVLFRGAAFVFPRLLYVPVRSPSGLHLSQFNETVLRRLVPVKSASSQKALQDLHVRPRTASAGTYDHPFVSYFGVCSGYQACGTGRISFHGAFRSAFRRLC
jgi:hypothetical protein